MLGKYPGTMMISISAYYALDITPQNKDQILKDVYKLYKFLKDKKFVAVYIHFNFYNENLFKGMDSVAIHEKFKNKMRYGLDEAYSLNITPENIKYFGKVKNYKDINKFVFNDKKEKYSWFLIEIV